MEVENLDKALQMMQNIFEPHRYNIKTHGNQEITMYT